LDQRRRCATNDLQAVEQGDEAYERRCKVEVIGFTFGLLALVVAMGASGRTRKLEKQLKEAGVLK
jgi:hypothetical protein